MKNVIIVGLLLLLSGCATMQNLVSTKRPEYTANKAGAFEPALPDDLKHKFISVSERPDFTDKIKSGAYERVGWISYDVPYNEDTLKDVVKLARDNNVDGLIEWETNHKYDTTFYKYYGISMVAIKLTK